MRVRMVAVALGAVTLVAAGGCAQSDPVDDGSSSLPAAPVTSPTASPDEDGGPSDEPTWTYRPEPSPTGFSEYTAVACAGRVSAAEIVQLLRRQSVLDATARPTVKTGPLCAGTWQYTVFDVSGHDPLEVVTERQPTGLVLITAGTNPCTARVRGTAPPGILDALKCD
jgi:hypothetical protein